MVFSTPPPPPPPKYPARDRKPQILEAMWLTRPLPHTTDPSQHAKHAKTSP